jgi:hypothetical protein
VRGKDFEEEKEGDGDEMAREVIHGAELKMKEIRGEEMAREVIRGVEEAWEGFREMRNGIRGTEMTRNQKEELRGVGGPEEAKKVI